MAVFARVVEEKGFSSAARRLGISKSAVSKQISQLEDRVGARLLHRTTRRLSLTDVGMAFYERCARILAEVEEAELAVSHLQSSPRGTLRLSGPMSFGRQYLAAAVAEFMKVHTELKVDMDLADRVVDLVDEGYDMAVRIGRLSDSSLIARRLCPMPLYVCGAPSYLERAGSPQLPDDLRQHECLMYAYHSGETWQLHGEHGDLSVPVSGRFRVNNGEALLEAALAGLGLAILPAFMSAPALADGRLTEVLPRWRPMAQAIHAVYPHNRHLSAKVRLFVDFLAERLAPRPWEPDGERAVGDPS
jgi:DNA-binding transcriptional LysR family regulator